jgi:hypothetical protein
LLKDVDLQLAGHPPFHLWPFLVKLATAHLLASQRNWLLVTATVLLLREAGAIDDVITLNFPVITWLAAR